jgi:hypothetical protein
MHSFEVRKHHVVVQLMAVCIERVRHGGVGHNLLVRAGELLAAPRADLPEHHHQGYDRGRPANAVTTDARCTDSPSGRPAGA